ncbi:MAG: hypothetical protein JWM82_494 [Myxococcales bacterium]|nr:hypothetical protein [Myxococcales bacterium]
MNHDACLPRIRLPRAALAVVAVGAALACSAPRLARADEFPSHAPSDPFVRAFVQPGIGLVELGNVKAGVFLGPHLSLEGMAAWTGVYGARWGGGLTAFLGHAEGNRPPRSAFTVGARLMLDRAMTFESYSDDLSSYVALPVGYSLIRDNGLFFTATLAPVIVRERSNLSAATTTTHDWTVSGPLFNLGIGIVFPR